MTAQRRDGKVKGQPYLYTDPLAESMRKALQPGLIQLSTGWDRH
jgi:hypothetical protein